MSTSSSRPARSFEFSCPGVDHGEIVVRALRGREAMNESYSFQLTLGLPTGDEAAFTQAVLGRRGTIVLLRPHEPPRIIHGIVASIEAEGRSSQGTALVVARLVPRFWLLTLRQNSRIFQDLDVQQISALLLSEHRVSYAFRLTRSHPKRQYCVQYQETDAQFLTRIWAEEGIFFHFEHPSEAEPEAAPGEVLVLADSPGRTLPIDGQRRLHYRALAEGQSAMLPDADHVFEFRSTTALTSTAIALRDYDFRRPLLELDSVAQSPSATGEALEVYDHHGEYEETDVDDARAETYLQQLQVLGRSAAGRTACRRLLPGRSFELADHELPSLDGDWLITAVEHEAHARIDDTTREYAARLWCVPSAVAFRPARPCRTLRQTQETARVVGPPGHEIFVDTLGRIKVQFHWDRHGNRDQYSSCWIRVAQAWAGNGWGHQFIPRVGMEVLVSFLGGDQDRPIVAGAVYNAMNPTPHGLPASATRSGIRTRSTPGGGGSNEIAFEDQSGSELLLVHAAKDYHEHVTVDRRTTIGHNDTLDVQGDRQTSVVGMRQDETSGGHRSRIGGEGALVVEGNLSLEAKSNAMFRVSGQLQTQIEGSQLEQIDGARMSEVGGEERLRVRGDRSLLVDGDATTTVDGHAKITVEGLATLNATDGLNVAVGTLRDPKLAHLMVSGGLVLDCGASVEFRVEKEFRIRAGKSELVVSREGIYLEAPKIEMAADSISANGGGAGLLLSGKALISGSLVKASSEGGAVLELDGVAKLDGPAVHLRPGAGAESAARAKREQEIAHVEKETIVLYDRVGDPIFNAPYEVSLPGYLDVGVAASASIEIPRFPDVERCTVRWSRPSTPGQSKTPKTRNAKAYEFQSELYLIIEHEDPDETLRRKLVNLGFDEGSLSSSAYAFQLAAGREPTGRADDVRAEVEALYAQSRTVRRQTDEI